MKTFRCACTARLFATNTDCSSCGRKVGWCDACGELASVSSEGRCENDSCLQPVLDCAIREQYHVCNGLTTPDNTEGGLCNSCRRTTVIPDTSIPRNLTRWQIMEQAKRRLLYELRQLGFEDEQLDGPPPLTFEFKADTATEKVTTGHADGVITLKLAEADPVVREQARQQFGEPQRTVIGHLRHEFGHYWWMTLIEGRLDAEFRDLFGDPTSPSYADAMPRYYEQGPPGDWQASFISEYAAAHPWEDFAETAGFYQDAMAMIDTLRHQVPALAPPADASLDSQLQSYMSAGIALNEIARTMGLTDVVPEVVSEVVIEKLKFVHRSRPR